MHIYMLNLDSVVEYSTAEAVLSEKFSESSLGLGNGYRLLKHRRELTYSKTFFFFFFQISLPSCFVLFFFLSENVIRE